VYRAFSPPAPAIVPTTDQAGEGFLVIGPADPVPGENAWNPGRNAALRCPAMSYSVPVTRGKVTRPPAPTLLLRRLACPDLPWQPDPTLDPQEKPYNPFVTVDYLENVPLNRGISNTGAGFQGRPLPVALRRSSGRQEPYDGNPRSLFPQAPT